MVWPMFLCVLALVLGGCDLRKDLIELLPTAGSRVVSFFVLLILTSGHRIRFLSCSSFPFEVVEVYGSGENV